MSGRTEEAHSLNDSLRIFNLIINSELERNDVCVLIWKLAYWTVTVCVQQCVPGVHVENTEKYFFNFIDNLYLSSSTWTRSKKSVYNIYYIYTFIERYWLKRLL